jgi:FAD/FMN-containing dehydrogenase
MKRRDEHKKILRFLIVTFTFFSLKALADEKLQSCTLTISDFSQSHEWTVQAIEAPHTITDLQNLVRSTNLPISVRGGGFSHGGQTVADNGLVIETKNMNRVVSYDPQQKTITVEPGITWKQVQEHIVKDGLAVEVMQSFNNFSVGGSLGVNVHGRYLAY